MSTPAGTLGTPLPGTLPTPSPGPANFASMIDGSIDEALGGEGEGEDVEPGAGPAIRAEKDKKKQVQQDGGCQLSTKEIETIFDARRVAEACVHISLVGQGNLFI